MPTTNTNTTINTQGMDGTVDSNQLESNGNTLDAWEGKDPGAQMTNQIDSVMEGKSPAIHTENGAPKEPNAYEDMVNRRTAREDKLNYWNRLENQSLSVQITELNKKAQQIESEHWGDMKFKPSKTKYTV